MLVHTQEFGRSGSGGGGGSPYVASSDPEWRFINEYDPLWPNDYEKVVKGGHSLLVLLYEDHGTSTTTTTTMCCTVILLFLFIL